jgi:F-type H+-transporting ATPase subunit a
MDKFDLYTYITHHVCNSSEWKLPFLPPILLPEYLTLHGLMVLLCALFLIILFCGVYRKNDRVPKGITNALEAFIIFIRDEIVIANLGPEDGRRMTPLFCTFFFFILGLNLMGLIPVFAGATSNINVTGALATITLGFMIIGTIVRNGVKGFILALKPSGVPALLIPFLFIIEFLGVFIKAAALTIRLFANMLAGHIVIVSLIGLVMMFGFIALPSIVMAVFIFLLEIFIALLQTYIFTFLSALFIGMMYHPHH